MKKRFLLLTALLTVLLVSTTSMLACTGKVKVGVYKLYAPDGAPLLPLVQMWGNETAVHADVRLEYNAVSGNNIAAEIASGRADIAIAPINVCANENVTKGGYTFVGVAVWGLMQIVSRDAALNTGDLKSLQGKTIAAFQKDNTPGITLMSILTEQGIEYTENEPAATVGKVNIVWLADPTAVASQLGAGKYDTALLAEPAATAQVTKTGSDLFYAYDVQKEWGKAHGGDSFPQAGVIVKNQIAKDNPAFVAALINALKSGNKYAVENPDKVTEFLTSVNSTLPAAINKFLATDKGKAALTFQSAKNSKKAVKDYLEAIAQPIADEFFFNK